MPGESPLPPIPADQPSVATSSPSVATSGGEPLPRPLLAAIVATVVLALLPILVSRIVPLHDYPNHLAVYNILAHYGDQPWMREFWDVKWEPLPNLGVELLVVALAKVLPIVQAGRVAVAVIVLLHGFGFLLLSREWSGKWSAWGLLGFPLAYVFPFNMGFLNYELGTGLLLFGVALHLRLRERPVARYALAMVPFAMLVTLAHMQAFGMFVLILATIEYGLRRNRERTPLSVRGALAKVGGLVPLPVVYWLLGSGRGEVGGFGVSAPRQKLTAFLRIFYLGEVRLDVAISALLLLLLLVAHLTGVRLAKTGWLVVGVLVVAFVISPEGFKSTHYLDLRQPALILTMALALALPVASRAMQAAVAVFVVARLGVVVHMYARRARATELVAAAIAAIPAGSLLFEVFPTQGDVTPAGEWEPPLIHAAALGAIENRTYPTMLFTFPGQQPLSVRPELRSVVNLEYIIDAEAPGYWARRIRFMCRQLPPAWHSRPIYVLWANGRGERARADEATPIVETPRWSLYRLDDPATYRTRRAASR